MTRTIHDHARLSSYLFASLGIGLAACVPTGPGLGSVVDLSIPNSDDREPTPGAPGASTSGSAPVAYARVDEATLRAYSVTTEPRTVTVEAPGTEEPVVTPPPTDSPLRELHVSQSGSDGASGTAGDPWRTLTYAASQLQAGDWLYVHGGPWNEGLDLSASGTSADPIRVLAADGASFDLTQNTTGAPSVVTISGSHIHVVGFDITASITAFDIGDGLYPLNDVCNDLEAFERGVEATTSYGYCDDRPLTNHQVSDVVIDGWNDDEARRSVIDLAATPTSWQLGVNIADEVSNLVIRNYEMANMRHAVFADGQDMVRVVDGLILDNLYVHDTRNYGVRIVSRDTFIPSEATSGQLWNSYDGGILYLEENMARSQTIRNLTISRSSFVNNGHTNPSTGEGYGNMLLQGIEGGVVERSTFVDGPYWGLDALICDDMIFRNNVFHVSDAVRYAERIFPSPDAAWPLVGLEVNGGTNNKVYNNVFHNFESGLFESYFPEDFARTTISVDVQNNLFYGNSTSIRRFPATEWLSNAEEVVPNGSMLYIPMEGMTVQRTESNNMMDIGVNYDDDGSGQLVQYLNGDVEFYGTANVVDASLNFAFTDVSSGDFHLIAGSAAIDRGVSLPEVTDDFDGTPRGAAVDLGPFEL